MWFTVFEVVLRLAGFFLGFMGKKKESKIWMAKASEILRQKGLVRSKFVLELEASRDDYLNKKLEAMGEENPIVINSLINKETVLYISDTPGYGDNGEDVKILQQALNNNGDDLIIDGDFGNKTKRAVSLFQISKNLSGSGILGPKTLKFLKIKLKKRKYISGEKAPWFWKLKKYEGKSEFDKDFNKEISSYWSKVGLPGFKTIIGSKRAWCGLFIAVGLVQAGLTYQKNGAGAKNWDKYGQKIQWKVNGFPQGAIIRINPKSCTSGSGNHVTMANGYCSAKDLNKSGATFSGYGGNQGQKAKVSGYRVSTICTVSWPKEEPLPNKVLKSINCSNGKTTNGESTR